MMMMINYKKREKRFSLTGATAFLFLLLIVMTLSYSCKKSYIPRPYGYFRVDLPDPAYRYIDTLNLPYRFALSEIAVIKKNQGERSWIDISYPTLNAMIHCSYKAINGNLFELSEDSRRFVYAHSSRADGIPESYYEHPEKSVYGVLYDIKGNVASQAQFVLTDSIHHFFRGALYFNNVPNKDSIAPIANYIREDIIVLMESFEWK